ncbi:MAG: heparin lyase I family protein [Caldilineaceae bacterium]|nr:heparin lyase I family protein [Caldilineaceae bacterium]
MHVGKSSAWTVGCLNDGRQFVHRGMSLSRPLILIAMILGLLLCATLSKPVVAQAEPATEPAILFLPSVSTDNPADEAEPIAQTDETVLPAGVVWQADMETADLSQWGTNNGSATDIDSGLCYRPANGVGTEQAHSGSYSMKMTIDSRQEAGCRQFRKAEPASGYPLYYSAWFYIPQKTQVGTFWNIMQFKSKLNGESGLFWKLDVRNDKSGNMGVMLVWKGPIAGPQAGDGIAVRKYEQAEALLPVGKWFKLEIYLKQSEGFDGQITVWRDGVLLYDVQNVRTKFPGGIQNWSINNYGKGLLPNPATLYVDDVTISTVHTGP